LSQSKPSLGFKETDIETGINLVGNQGGKSKNSQHAVELVDVPNKS
jgi:hypothetical protein